jgi:hypothetical protein
MEIATDQDMERYKQQVAEFFSLPWIMMFDGYLTQRCLIMEFLASRENKTIYGIHLEKFNKLKQ